MSDNAAAAAVTFPPAIPIPEEPAPAAKAEAPEVSPAPPPVTDDGARQTRKAEAVPPDKPLPEAPPEEPPQGKMPAVVAAPAPPESTSPKKPRVPAPPPGDAAPVRKEAPSGPAWARENETLAYRVDFLGITMGYARFRFVGKVSIGGRTAYHLNVRAWTSGILSYIYPINDTIDYYLDYETIEPIRIEYTGRRDKKDDTAVYDQEKGKIVYRYRHNGEIRKVVDVVPGIHDPVSATYYFRWRDMGEKGRERNVYGGRKVYRISTLLLGKERLRTDPGPVDTLVVQPVIRRDGKIENKGDLRMWVSDDERHVPVRFYAKFRKIKEWTLVGELLPERTGG